MCVFNTPKAPPPVVVPDPPAAPVTSANTVPEAQDPAVQESRTRDRQRRLRASAANNTLVTGGQGLIEPANTGTKQLYGV